MAPGQRTAATLGLFFSRWEIGVTIFFVLSGFPPFVPWVDAAANGSAWPKLGRYIGRRTQRIMPAYVVTVVIAYLVYQLHPLEPNPGYTWTGLWRHLTLTQTYTGDYMQSYLHQGLTQTWSLASEAAFYPHFLCSPRTTDKALPTSLATYSAAHGPRNARLP